MTDPTPTSAALQTRLRLHAHDLVNGGTNASELRNDLNAAAAALAASERAIRELVVKRREYADRSGFDHPRICADQLDAPLSASAPPASLQQTKEEA